MRVLVTGLHRSGTSVTAKLLAALTNLSLLDDPQWAIVHPSMAGAYHSVNAYRDELESYDIVKCPRMGECLDKVLSDFPLTQIVYVVRDPRDIFCSIAEAQKSPHWTVQTMADNKRFGEHVNLCEGVSLAYKYYANQALVAAQRCPARLTFIAYADLYFHPELTLKRLSQRIGLSLVNSFPHNLRLQQLAPLRNKVPGETSIKGVNRWKKELDSSTASLIMDTCGAEFLALMAHCEAQK